MRPRILVVGAGAVGGYLGGRLLQAGRDVDFLVRDARAATLRRDGLRISSPHGDAILHPNLVRAGHFAGAYDIVLLAVKGRALAGAMDDMASAVGAETMILPVLNGMRHVDELADRFGRRTVLGGACRLATQVDGTGAIRQLAPMQHLVYGELDGSSTPRLQALDEAMQGIGFETVRSDDVVQAMWDKWVQLSSLGAVTCLFRGSVGAVVEAPGGDTLVRSIVDECVAIATACGHPPSEAFVEAHRATMTAAGSPMTSSMFRDLNAGAPVEADRVVGDLLDLGDAQGVAAPLLRAAFVNLHVYQAGLNGNDHHA